MNFQLYLSNNSLITDNESDTLDQCIELGIPFFRNWLSDSIQESEQTLILVEICKLLNMSNLKNSEELKSIKISKTFVEALYQSGRSALSQANIDVSVAIFNILTHLIPDVYDVWQGLGIALQANKSYLRASQAFQKAIQLHPQLFQSYLYLGECLLELGCFSESKNCLLEALNLMTPQDEAFSRYAKNLIIICNKESS